MNRDGDRSAADAVVCRASDEDEPAIVELNRIHNGEDAAVEIRSAFGAGLIAPATSPSQWPGAGWFPVTQRSGPGYFYLVGRRFDFGSRYQAFATRLSATDD
jgi:hypothetical protein